MAGFSVGGLASGLDTASMIEQLMAIERQPRVRLDLREKQAEARKTALNDVASRLRALATAASDLRSAGLWGDVQTVDVNDATKLSFRQTSTAAPGAHSVTITTMARAAQRTYAYTVPTVARTVTINGVNVDLAVGTDLAGAASAINAKSDTGVIAVADTATNTLKLSTRATGTAAPFTVSGGGPTLNLQSSIAATNAAYTIDGVAGAASQTNVITNGIPGIELTFKATGSVTVNVSAPAPDTSALKTKLKAFVDKYNETVDYLRAKVSEKPVAGATSTTDALKGLLYGDTMITGVLSQMRSAISNAISGNPAATDALADLGITTGASTGTKPSADTLAGKLTIDDAKLSSTLATNLQGVEDFLKGIGTGLGFAQTFENVLSPLTQSGGTIDGRVTSADSEIARLKDSMTAMDARLALKEDRLRAQFAALEKAMSSSQQQGSWLSGQLASLAAA